MLEDGPAVNAPDVDLNAIRSRLAAATPGPWERSTMRDTEVHWVCAMDDMRVVAPSSDHLCAGSDDAVNAEWEGDFDLIAHAPTDLADLLALVNHYRDIIAGMVGSGGPPLVSETRRWWRVVADDDGSTAADWSFTDPGDDERARLRAEQWMAYRPGHHLELWERTTYHMEAVWHRVDSTPGPTP